jgi:hypothetical protein
MIMGHVSSSVFIRRRSVRRLKIEGRAYLRSFGRLLSAGDPWQGNVAGCGMFQHVAQQADLMAGNDLYGYRTTNFLTDCTRTQHIPRHLQRRWKL